MFCVCVHCWHCSTMIVPQLKTSKRKMGLIPILGTQQTVESSVETTTVTCSHKGFCEAFGSEAGLVLVVSLPTQLLNSQAQRQPSTWEDLGRSVQHQRTW